MSLARKGQLASHSLGKNRPRQEGHSKGARVLFSPSPCAVLVSFVFFEFSVRSACVFSFKIFYMYLFALYVMCLCFVFCDNDFDCFIVQFGEDVDNFSVFCIVE